MIKSQRITLLNPHADDFIKTPVSFWLARRRGLAKYAYLIDEPVKLNQRVDVLVDGTLSSIFRQDWFAKLPHFVRLLVLKPEVYFWMTINGLKNHVVVHWSPDTIEHRGAIYIFSYKNCVGAFSERKLMIDAFSKKIVNLSHYFIRTGEKRRNILLLHGVVLVSEANISTNPYYKHNFSNLPLCVVPFAVGERFASMKSLTERKGVCAATGSFHNLYNEKPRHYYNEFINFFGLNTYHPVRKLLYQHRNELADWLDVRISLYRRQNSGNGLIKQLLGFFGLDIAQTEYFSFDIVKFYCDHKFAIVGEEASGLPAIGFFEAMACGCVMLGQYGAFYDGLGLEPGVHYLVHDGSIEGIRAVIDDALAHPERLASISKAGKKYISKHCQAPAVWDKLLRHLTGVATATSVPEP